MFDSFPFDEWGDGIAEFWTWGGGGSTGTWILTILGFAVTLVAFVGFVRLENGKLDHQAQLLRASGALDRPPDLPDTLIPEAPGSAPAPGLG